MHGLKLKLTSYLTAMPPCNPEPIVFDCLTVTVMVSQLLFLVHWIKEVERMYLFSPQPEN